MDHFRSVSVSFSKTVAFTPLKPLGSEIRDRGVFSCALTETTENPSRYRQSPQRVASLADSPVRIAGHKQRQPWNAHHVPIDRSGARSLSSPAETIRSGYQPVRLSQAVSGFRRRVRTNRPPGYVFLIIGPPETRIAAWHRPVWKDFAGGDSFWIASNHQ